MNWKDGLKREFDFILDVMEGEPGPRETMLPYNPALVRELGVKKRRCDDRQAHGDEGIIRESKEKIELGRRYWFMPRRCMLQWRHSGLVNAVTRLKDGSYRVRIEGLFIG